MDVTASNGSSSSSSSCDSEEDRAGQAFATAPKLECSMALLRIPD